MVSSVPHICHQTDVSCQVKQVSATISRPQDILPICFDSPSCNKWQMYAEWLKAVSQLNFTPWVFCQAGSPLETQPPSNILETLLDLLPSAPGFAWACRAIRAEVFPVTGILCSAFQTLTDNWMNPKLETANSKQKTARDAERMLLPARQHTHKTTWAHPLVFGSWWSSLSEWASEKGQGRMCVDMQKWGCRFQVWPPRGVGVSRAVSGCCLGCHDWLQMC